MQLTQKEKMLLQDQKKHEEMCVKKYNEYANQAQDPELKQLFTNYAQAEQQHLNTVNQILSGQAPSPQQMGQQQGQQQGQQMQQQQQQQSQQMQQQDGQMAGGNARSKDAFLCNDMLMTEKHVSSAYDTAIFESTNTQIRQALNHIQKEEQQHGEGLFNYLQKNNMYNPS